MSRCLDRKTLFLLSEGEAGENERSHLQSCQACAKQYDEIERDLRLITTTLRQEPPPNGFAASGASIFLKTLPVAAGVLLAAALMWGESRLWRPDSTSEQKLGGDVSQFLEQVSEAIFDGRSMREVGIAASDSDLASVQVALGENCSDQCRSLFNEWSSTNTRLTKAADRPAITAKKRPIDLGMQRLVSDRGE
jgi:hypothetical protein